MILLFDVVVRYEQKVEEAKRMLASSEVKLVELRHTSHVTRRTSHVTRHTSHVTRHTSHVTRHTSHITRHTSQLKLVELKRNVESVREKVHQSLDDAPPDSKVKKSKTSLDGVPTFKPVTSYKPEP